MNQLGKNALLDKDMQKDALPYQSQNVLTMQRQIDQLNLKDGMLGTESV